MGEIKMETGGTTPEKMDTWESHEKKIQAMERNVGQADKEDFQNEVEALFDDLDGASLDHGHELYKEFFLKWDKRIELSK